MAQERTVYANLSDEELDARAEFKLDLSPYWGGPYEPLYAAYVKRRFWFFSWWACVFKSNDLERCTEHLQTIIQLPRRFTRKVVPKP